MADRHQLTPAVSALSTYLITASVPTEAANLVQDKRLTVLLIEIYQAAPSTNDAGGDGQTADDLRRAWLTRVNKMVRAQGGQVIWQHETWALAAFGAPAVGDNEAERAVRAAHLLQLDLPFFLNQRQSRPQRESPDDTLPTQVLRLRSALHTLEAADLERLVHQTDGHEPLAALLEQLHQAAPFGAILASETTCARLGSLVRAELVKQLAAVGGAPETRVYRITAVQPLTLDIPILRLEGISAAMVGRERELADLQALLHALHSERQARLVTVIGEPGIGKSRLLYELCQSLARQANDPFWIFQGQAVEQGTPAPYSLIRALLLNRFQIHESDPALLAQNKLAHGLLGFLGEQNALQAHFIGHLIGLDFSGSPHLQGVLNDAHQIRDRAFHYLGAFFHAVHQVNDHPVVVMLEDIHWADSGSLDWLNYLVYNCRDIPLLILCTARPTLLKRRATWGQDLPAYTQFDLRALSTAETQTMLQGLLRRVPALSADFVDMVVEQAGGNPFHLEELVKALIDAGVIVTGGEEWHIQEANLVRSRFNATLPALLRDRVELLPAVERAALLGASVVGRVFWDSAVADLSGWSLIETRAALEALEKRELVFRRAVSTFNAATEYTFKHALLQEVAYGVVEPDLLRHYHARVATWLIGRGMGRVGEIAGLIAEHFARAEETSRAVKWYGLAGKQARDTYAPEAALDYYQTALSLLPEESGDLEQRLNLTEGAGRALHIIGQFKEAAIVYRAMQEAAASAGNLTAQARAWNHLSTVQERLGQAHLSLQSAQNAAVVARQAGIAGQTELVMAWLCQGSACMSLGNLEVALIVCQQALDLSIQLDQKPEIAFALNLVGVAHALLGRYAEAMRYFSEALGIAREVGDLRREAILSNNLGELSRRRGDYRTALVLYQRALETARSISYRPAELVALCNLGAIWVHLGELTTAESHLRDLIPTIEKAGHRELLAEAVCYLAEALHRQSKVEEALSAALSALQIAQQANLTEKQGVVWRTLGRIAAITAEPILIGEQPCDAVACFKESLRLLIEGNMEGEQARTLRTWAHYELAYGDHATGEAMWYQAKALFTKTGAEQEVEAMTRLPGDDQPLV